MKNETTKMGWFLRGTAVMALTVAGATAQAQTVIVGTDDPSVTTNGNDVQSGAEVGGIENTVTLTGDYSSNGTTTTYEVKAFENVDVEDADPDLDITKVATIGGAAVPTTGAALGDIITYTYVVSNTGNVTMTNLALTDVHNNASTATGDLSAIICNDVDDGLALTNPVGDTTLPSTFDNTILTIGAGDSVTCTATYTVEQADIDTLQNP